jgi:hypothetical protein
MSPPGGNSLIVMIFVQTVTLSLAMKEGTIKIGHIYSGDGPSNATHFFVGRGRWNIGGMYQALIIINNSTEILPKHKLVPVLHDTNGFEVRARFEWNPYGFTYK